MGFQAGPTEGSSESSRAAVSGAPGAGHAAAPGPAWAAVAVLLVVPVLAAAAATSTLLPVWWATLIGSRIGRDPAGGIALGMTAGFACTLAPLLAAWPACRYRAGRPRKAAALAAALAAVLLLAAPNLLTLGICFGTSGSARQARRMLGAEAGWFMLWTLYSAIAAALVFAAMVVLWTAWRRWTAEPLQITPRG